MKPSHALLFVLLAAVALSLAADVAAADEKCRRVRARVLEGVFYEPGECPVPYDGPAKPDPTVELGCYVQPVVGMIRGTWIYYFPSPDNCVRPMPFEESGAVWGEGWELWACWALSTYQSKRGNLYTETLEGTHSAAFSFSSLPYVDLGIVIGGTGRYEGATGWLGGAFDDDGGPLTGRVCTPHHKKK